MKTALVQQTNRPDVLGVARHRIVLRTPGQPMTVLYFTGARDRIVLQLRGAGYAVEAGRGA